MEGCRELGTKIINNSKQLVDRLSPIENLEANYTNYLIKLPYWMETLFSYLGQSLMEEGNLVEEKIQRWANAFGQRSSESEIPLDHALHFIFETRVVICEFLEEESITADTVTKICNNIHLQIDLAARSIVTHYTTFMHNTKKALQHTNRNLDISIAELNNIRTALFEATIFSITDKDNHIIQVNDHFCRLTKYDRNELIGQDHGKIFVSGVHSDEYLDHIKQEIKAGRVWNGEICNKAKDGSLYWVDTTIIPFLDPEGVAYQHISIQYDVTEKKKTEEILLKSEKVSLIGDLAAGIAHEIRNPLTSIGGLVQLFNESDPEKNAFYKDIILTEINRINFIVSELMVLAKPHAVYFSWFNITDSVQNVIDLMQPEANLRNVVISFEKQDRIPLVYGEKNQLTQVIINMIKNAMEALPNGGRIQLSAASSGDNIVLYIKDNGVGMTEEQKKRLGEPFYTTKFNGTGLGLMVCFKIIQNHRGTIEVDSVFNEGTTFTITLPMHSAANVEP
ncbi:ATP-binding protein [Fictibacillus sp. b24]|uniref:ATP-binding protein n=1 Tax=Fictibacillus sp. b24 TaxID=3055863 RepID=UPI00259FF890|nr:ATP-binding protein [Fictibacillus sp. b24]MDM5314979.1 ATP-binding protein [Fictibacillus sp. b24]